MFQMPQKLKFGQRTPPAIFPPVFGLLGVGLAWRRAEAAFMTPPAIADFLLGMIALLFLWCLFAYGVKVLRRPGVFLEDLAILPGRAGLSAMMLSLFLMAAVLLPYGAGLSTVVLIVGLAGYGLLWLVLAWVKLTGPAEQRIVNPVWHLAFVGFIIAPLSAIPLGFVAASKVVFWVSLGIAVVIWAISLRQILQRDPPPPLRPLLAIHLAPASLFGIVAVMLGWTQVAIGFALLGGVILLALLLRARYITAAGFSPLWGAFTFPLAAYANLMLALANGQGDIFRVIGAVLLIAATFVVPVIAVKVLQGWAKGQLAAKTNAATA